MNYFEGIFERYVNLKTVLDPKEMSYFITKMNRRFTRRVWLISEITDGSWWDFLNDEVDSRKKRKGHCLRLCGQ